MIPRTAVRASDCFCFLHEIGGRMHWLDMRMVDIPLGALRNERRQEAVI